MLARRRRESRKCNQVDRIGKPLGLKRSAIVREALRDWLRRHAVTRFEEDWIAAVKKQPGHAGEVDAWTGVQAWSKK